MQKKEKSNYKRTSENLTEVFRGYIYIMMMNIVGQMTEKTLSKIKIDYL